VWPHAILSGHAHNYQRYTRVVDDMQIPYLVAGGGGSALSRISTADGIQRTPFKLPGPKDGVTLETYDDQDYGFLTVPVDDQELRIDYRPVLGQSARDQLNDSVSVDLKTRQLVNH
jgi:hypothetical protein